MKRCKAVYDFRHHVMTGARCELQSGHKGDHKTKWGVASAVFGPKPEDCKVIQDGSQGWSWPRKRKAS